MAFNILYILFPWLGLGMFLCLNQKKEWINRGFLHGPGLPIYGFGAIIILWLTLPFKDNLLLVFILGMLGASILEYVTGIVMERLFHMRYWDYSSQKFNLNGYISLFTSLGWGLLSTLLVKFIHPLVDDLILRVPSFMSELLSLILMIIFVVDVTKSVQKAFDIKKLMKKLTENKEYLDVLQATLDNVIANVSEGSDDLNKKLHLLEDEVKENFASFQYRNKTQKEQFIDKLNGIKLIKSRFFNLLNEKIDGLILDINLQMRSTESENKLIDLSKTLTDLNRLKDGLRKADIDLSTREDKEIKSVANLLKKYPTAVSKRFKTTLEEMKSIHISNKKENNKK